MSEDPEMKVVLIFSSNSQESKYEYFANNQTYQKDVKGMEKKSNGKYDKSICMK